MRITRRTFIKGAGGAGIAAVAVGATGKMLEKAAHGKNSTGVLDEKFVPSVCRQCPGGCGILVRVVNGKAVKIEGNPKHPINYAVVADMYSGKPGDGVGGLCPKGAAGVQLALYDPDRIKGPLKRTNPKKGMNEDPKFVPVSWDEALNDIAGRMKKLRAEGKANTVMIMSGRNRGQAGKFIGDFLTLYGSVNNIGHGSLCAHAHQEAKFFMDGNNSYNSYDWANTNYILDFGAAFLEAFRPTTTLLRQWGYLRRRNPKPKFVYFDTRTSVTLSKADEGFIVNPNSDGAIAMAMNHVILTEGLWNKEFVGDFKDGVNRFQTGKAVDAKSFNENWTKGLVDWWNIYLKDFTPQRAAAISGISAADIKRVAKEFATTGPQIACGERGSSCYTNGTENAMAIHALNGLMGNLFIKGGMAYQEKPKYSEDAYPPIHEYMDEVALSTSEVKKEIDPKTKKEKIKISGKAKKYPKYQDVPDAYKEGKPYKLSMVFTYLTNPLFSPANPQRFQEVFKDVFIVDTSPFISETGLYADYILPDHTYLETYLDDTVYPSLGFACTGIRQPVVKPLFDTRSTLDVWGELGKRIGGKMGEYYNKMGDSVTVLKKLCKGLDITWEKWLSDGVWYKAPYPYLYSGGKFHNIKDNKEMTPEEVKEKLYKTPSGKFEFRSGNMEHHFHEKYEKEMHLKDEKDPKKIEEIEAKIKAKVAEKEKELYPQYKKIEFAGGKDFDLHLNTGKPITTAEGRSANTPFIQEILQVDINRGWETYCTMNPKSAAERGISDGALVWVESPVGKIKCRVALHQGMHPKVVLIPKQNGHYAYGRWAKGRGGNPCELIVDLSDHHSGLQAYFQTMVKVYKA
jgi:anaerobic selenocysteine-containing dehydrogenase